MADHPSPIELEQWQVDRSDEDVARHLESCDACRRYVAELDRARQSFLARERPEDFVRRVRRADPEAPRRRRRLLPWLAAPAAGAALLLVALLLVPRPRPDADGPIRFKGRPRLAVILLRDGVQTRRPGPLTIRAGDRLRVELTLPRRQRVTVGIVEQGKGWVPLLEDRLLDAGVHLMPTSLRVDSPPAAGWIVAGSPPAVRRAVSQRRFLETPGATALRLEVGGSR